MKRISFLFSFLLITVCSFAQRVCVEGIYYNIDPDTKTASVTITEGAEYSDGAVFNNNLLLSGKHI